MKLQFLSLKICISYSLFTKKLQSTFQAGLSFYFHISFDNLPAISRINKINTFSLILKLNFFIDNLLKTILICLNNFLMFCKLISADFAYNKTPISEKIAFDVDNIRKNLQMKNFD